MLNNAPRIPVIAKVALREYNFFRAIKCMWPRSRLIRTPKDPSSIIFMKSYHYLTICRYYSHHGACGAYNSFKKCAYNTAHGRTTEISWCKLYQWQKLFMFHTSAAVAKMRKPRELKQYKNIITFKPKPKYPSIQLWAGITVAELAEKTNRRPGDVFEAMSYVENCSRYKSINSEILNLTDLHELAKKLGYRVNIIKKPGSLTKVDQKNYDIVKRPPPDPEELMKRPPVVTIMGHVDHGKTTLLDALRHTSVVAQEHGGITQHIGAFTVKLPEGQITFLDTPGHAAFKAMRSRGAHATDLVVLVVAADDGIMEQTLESIRFAKEAGVPIIVAINKIDKPRIDIEAVKQSLLAAGIQLEDLGGEVQAVCISALKKLNLEQLTEAIITQAEIMEIGGDPKGPVEGVVLETCVEHGKGKLSTALIQRGTLKKGTILVAGTSWAKVRGMFDEHKKAVKEATPGIPVQVIGWKSLPSAGDEIFEAKSEKHAQEVVKYRESEIQKEKMENDNIVIQKKLDQHLEKYCAERTDRLLRGRFRKERSYFREKEIVWDTSPYISFVLKGDVDGSVEAIIDVVNTYQGHDACRLDVIHSAVGDVTENDALLAESFDGFIYCFNVNIPPQVKAFADARNIQVKCFNVIYHLIDDIKKEISNKLPLVQEEDILGAATVLQEFVIKEGKKKVPVAGCRCTKGFLKKNALCKVIRSDKVIYQGPVVSLRHEKNNVESIKKDVECGLRIEDLEVNFLPGDEIICYTAKNVSQVTDWNPGF